MIFSKSPIMKGSFFSLKSLCIHFRKDLEGLCEDLQLDESVDDLMLQFGADDEGKISYGQFLLCHKNILLNPTEEDKEGNKMSSSNGVIESPTGILSPNSQRKSFWRRRDPKSPVKKGEIIFHDFFYFNDIDILPNCFQGFAIGTGSGKRNRMG